MEELKKLMIEYMQQGFDIKTTVIGNSLRIVITDPEGKVSEDFYVTKINKN